MTCCDYCLEEGAVATGTCTNRCAVYAHDECVAKRHAMPLWRKKHTNRGNHEAELCPRPGCHGKMRFRRVPGGATNDIHLPKTNQERATIDLQDPLAPCSFVGRDGRPCRRKAIDQGACRLHARDAAVLRQMTQSLEQDEVTCLPCDKQTTAQSHEVTCPRREEPMATTLSDAATQTEDESQLRKDLEDTHEQLEVSRSLVRKLHEERRIDRARAARHAAELAKAMAVVQDLLAADAR